MICPPVASAELSNMFRLLCDIFNKSSIGELGEGYTCMVIGSSTNQQPNSLRVFPERQNLKVAQFPESLRTFSMGVLAISQIAGATIFICPSSCWGGGVAYSPPVALVWVSKGFTNWMSHVLEGGVGSCYRLLWCVGYLEEEINYDVDHQVVVWYNIRKSTCFWYSRESYEVIKLAIFESLCVCNFKCYTYILFRG